MSEIIYNKIMPEWSELIFKCGELIAFIVLTLLFLQYVTKRDESMAILHKACEDRLEAITNKCIDTLDKNTRALTEIEKKLEYLLK